MAWKGLDDIAADEHSASLSSSGSKRKRSEPMAHRVPAPAPVTSSANIVRVTNTAPTILARLGRCLFVFLLLGTKLNFCMGMPDRLTQRTYVRMCGGDSRLSSARCMDIGSRLIHPRSGPSCRRAPSWLRVRVGPVRGPARACPEQSKPRLRTSL